MAKAKVEIYITDYCPYCTKAKALLTKKGVSFQEYDVTGKTEEREKLVQKANGLKTVPQIFINDQHIGGCDSLYELEGKGELDKLLSA